MDKLHISFILTAVWIMFAIIPYTFGHPVEKKDSENQIEYAQPLPERNRELNFLLDDDQEEWDRDIYTGQHLNDILLPTTHVSDRVVQNTVLIMYKPSCKNSLDELGINYKMSPPQTYLVFAKHDWETTLKNVPYRMDGVDNVVSRYSPAQCPTALYFEKGSSIHTPHRWVAGNGSFIEWIWSHFKVKTTVVNTGSNSLEINQYGPGPNVYSGLVLHPGHQIEIESYVSYLITITMFRGEQLKPEFIYGSSVIGDWS